VSIDHVVVHFSLALFSLLWLVEADIPIAHTLPSFAVQHYLRLHNVVSSQLEHLEQVQVIESLPGDVANVNARLVIGGLA